MASFKATLFNYACQAQSNDVTVKGHLLIKQQYPHLLRCFFLFCIVFHRCTRLGLILHKWLNFFDRTTQMTNHNLDDWVSDLVFQSLTRSCCKLKDVSDKYWINNMVGLFPCWNSISYIWIFIKRWNSFFSINDLRI
jgi:hypothetical protein